MSDSTIIKACKVNIHHPKAPIIKGIFGSLLSLIRHNATLIEPRDGNPGTTSCGVEEYLGTMKLILLDDLLDL